jgi:hypothetical protein
VFAVVTLCAGGAYFLVSRQPGERTVWGYAHMARPLRGASVEISALDSDGYADKTLATAKTDDSGYYEVKVRANSTDSLLIGSQGGTYVDTATGNKVAAGDGSLFTVLLPGAERAPLTPLTTWAAFRAAGLMHTDGSVEDSVQASFAATARQFNLESIDGVDPAIASDGADLRTATTQSRHLGIILAGLELEAEALGVDAIDLVDALAEDIADGSLDGMGTWDEILIADEEPLPAGAMTVRLQEAIDRFVASQENQTHLPAPQIAMQAPAIELSGGYLYVSTAALPAWTEGRPGSATIEVRGGKGPYECTLAIGQLPAGFTLSPSCVISGSSTASLGKSTISVSPEFTISILDASSPRRVASVAFRITVVKPGPTIAVSGGRCPKAGVACSLTLATATGGTPPHYFTSGGWAGGAPPMGMTLGLDGVLTGTPAAGGSYSFDVCAVDLVGASDCSKVTVTVGESPSQTSLPAGFPPDLPAGTYRIQVCTSVAGIDLGTCVDGGTFEVTAEDASALADGLEEAADAIRRACSCSVRYTAFDGQEFDMVITDPDSGSVTTLRVTKVG